MVKVIKLSQPPKFEIGTVVATPGVMDKMDQEYALGALARHMLADWGLVGKADWDANDDALKHGFRLLSAYPLPHCSGLFGIVIEADRSVTTLLIPSEY